MSTADQTPSGRCHVVGGGKSVDAGAICGEIERAITAQRPKVQYTAEVRVLSPSRLAATLIVNGRTLPVQNFAVMDGKLGTGSIARFASALARAVVEATKS